MSPDALLRAAVFSAEPRLTRKTTELFKFDKRTLCRYQRDYDSLIGPYRSVVDRLDKVLPRVATLANIIREGRPDYGRAEATKIAYLVLAKRANNYAERTSSSPTSFSARSLSGLLAACGSFFVGAEASGVRGADTVRVHILGDTTEDMPLASVDEDRFVPGPLEPDGVRSYYSRDCDFKSLGLLPYVDAKADHSSGFEFLTIRRFYKEKQDLAGFDGTKYHSGKRMTRATSGFIGGEETDFYACAYSEQLLKNIYGCDIGDYDVGMATRPIDCSHSSRLVVIEISPSGPFASSVRGPRLSAPIGALPLPVPTDVVPAETPSAASTEPYKSESLFMAAVGVAAVVTGAVLGVKRLAGYFRSKSTALAAKPISARV